MSVFYSYLSTFIWNFHTKQLTSIIQKQCLMKGKMHLLRLRPNYKAWWNNSSTSWHYLMLCFRSSFQTTHHFGSPNEMAKDCMRRVVHGGGQELHPQLKLLKKKIERSLVTDDSLFKWHRWRAVTQTSTSSLSLPDSPKSHQRSCPQWKTVRGKNWILSSKSLLKFCSSGTCPASRVRADPGLSLTWIILN